MDAIKNNHDQLIGHSVDGWSPCAHPSRTTMQGRYCQLEALDIDAHADSLYESMSKNPVTDWTYLPYGPFEQFADFKAWLMRYSDLNDPLFYVITDAISGKALGLASYLRIDASVGAVEVGHIHYSKSLQRTPMATESMYLMMQRVFDELGYRRYEWKCDALNERSRAAARRLGFSFEGIFRQATIYKNRNRDTAWYSMIDSEWPDLKLAYENWLNPENFGPGGAQRQRLGIS